MCDEMSIVDGPNPCNTETPCKKLRQYQFYFQASPFLHSILFNMSHNQHPYSSMLGPIDAVVSPWSDWTACSKPCGPDGTTQRTRTCSSDGQNGGTMCDQMGLVDGPNPCNTDFDGKSGKCNERTSLAKVS